MQDVLYDNMIAQINFLILQKTLLIGTTWSKCITMISGKPSIYDINEVRGLYGVPSTTRDRSMISHTARKER
jgi:hypothetical protein